MGTTLSRGHEGWDGRLTRLWTEHIAGAPKADLVLRNDVNAGNQVLVRAGREGVGMETSDGQRQRLLKSS